MRLAFAGTPAAAVPALEALLSSAHEVAAVITRPDAPAGRGRTLHRSPVGLAAAAAEIAVMTPTRAGDPDFLDQLQRLGLDACAVVAYGNLLPQRTLDVPSAGWVNLHFSLLPRWRGAAPVQHAIRAGDEVTGVTTFRLERGMDTGPTFAMERTPIGATETAGELLDRLSHSGARVLVETFDALESGSAVATPQPADGVTLAPKLTVAESQVDFSADAAQVDRLIRSCTPSPGAWSTLRGSRVKLGPVRPVDDDAAPDPGRVLVGKHSVLVGSGSRPLELGVVQPQGKKQMSAADFARGVRLRDGETFTFDPEAAS